MCAAAEALFGDLAEAILDGSQIDWATAEANAAEEDRDLLEGLRVLATLAAVHRSEDGRAAQAPRESTPAADGQRPALLSPGSEKSSLDSALAAGAVEGSGGWRWEHLRILELIGCGASGEVYRAWDEKLDREVALKLVPARAPRSGAPNDPIIEEGRALARVRHPNVVTLYGADLIDGRIGLWMERIEGRTLEEILKDGRTFSPREVAALGAELARAVAAVHAAGLVHRDIKASNVMVGDDGRSVLMDFGTGRAIDDAAAPLAGTPLYLAPELFRAGDPSPRSDVYSLGVLLHHLLTASYPVHAADLDGLARAHASGQRTSVRSARPDVPARLAAVLDRALDPDPERRQPSAEALAAGLAAITRPRWRRAAPAIAAAATLVVTATAAWELRSGWTGKKEPTRAFLVGAGDRLGVASDARREAPPAIVVLPFENVGDRTDDEHFANGLAEEILRELARVDGLAVRSRHSSFSFRRRPLDLPAIGERLRVGYAVTGSVRRTGDRLRVSAQLVDLRSDRALWADRYDRTLVSSLDVFEITDGIARAIVNELRLTLGAGQRRYDVDVETYDLYLRARALGVPYVDRALEAIELYERILAIDPTFAPAHAGLAEAYFRRSLPAAVAGGLRFDTAIEQMRQAAERALALDPLLAEAHAAIGAVHARELRWKESERAFRRALELDPTSTSTYVQFSVSTLRPLGRNEEAERLLLRALEHDPLNVGVEHEIGILQFCTGRFEDAIATLERLGPDDGFSRVYLARALTFAGRIPEAMAVFDQMSEDPKKTHPAWYALALLRAGRRAEAEALAVTHRGDSHRELFIHAALGDRDRAFAALEREAVEHPQRVPMILTYPELALLRGDPRLAALQPRFRLP